MKNFFFRLKVVDIDLHTMPHKIGLTLKLHIQLPEHPDLIVQKPLYRSDPLESIDTHEIVVCVLAARIMPIRVVQIDSATGLATLQDKLHKLDLLIFCPDMTSLKVGAELQTFFIHSFLNLPDKIFKLHRAFI